MESRSYNSKRFTFHNIEVIRKYIDAGKFRGIQLGLIKWQIIMEALPNKTAL